MNESQSFAYVGQAAGPFGDAAWHFSISILIFTAIVHHEGAIPVRSIIDSCGARSKGEMQKKLRFGSIVCVIFRQMVEELDHTLLHRILIGIKFHIFVAHYRFSVRTDDPFTLAICELLH